MATRRSGSTAHITPGRRARQNLHLSWRLTTQQLRELAVRHVEAVGEVRWRDLVDLLTPLSRRDEKYVEWATWDLHLWFPARVSKQAQGTRDSRFVRRR
jgi:hypothetical protein